MLIDSPRLTEADRAAWARLERYDDKLASSPRLAALEERALDTITRHGPCYVSTSWGKDSTVLVDLYGRSGVDCTVVWMRIDGYDLPECETVRDLTLAKWPGLAYDELTLPPQPNRWWSTATSAQSKYQSDIGWRTIADRYGQHRATGIRADESKIRTLVQARWGDSGPHAARPISTWTAVDVFAYLAKRHLPVHTAYACSSGGRHDRRWLRVHSLGGVTGADRGRADWETAYYGDVIRTSRLRDHLMSRLPPSRIGRLTAGEAAAGSPVPAHDAPGVLASLEDRHLVMSHTRVGQTRWWRTCDWPPAPSWLRDGPPAATQDGLL